MAVPSPPRLERRVGNHVSHHYGMRDKDVPGNVSGESGTPRKMDGLGERKPDRVELGQPSGHLRTEANACSSLGHFIYLSNVCSVS